MDTTGTLDEALERLHTSGPEREGWLSNHAPMAVEALVRNGQQRTVHRWLDRYRHKLEDMPAPGTPVTADTWQEALGDPARLADWTLFFARQLAEQPWRDVLGAWWPRLLPGMPGAATHTVIRTGHAVRTLLDDEAGGDLRPDGSDPGPRLTELAHALGYWAARHAPLPDVRRLPAAGSAGAGLDAVPLIDDRSGGIRDRLARLSALPERPGPPDPDDTAAEDGLRALVRAAAHRYATHAHGEPVMLVHAVTGPNAVLRILPALPRDQWAASLDVAWAVGAAVTAVYSPAEGAPPVRAGSTSPEEVFERAAAHGDEHAIKLADTVLDVASWDPDGDRLELAAALRGVELIEPVF
ncbi:questin oxidase family protein [Streptomyces boncukensis]|uniref:Questin oxidase family protein n=1 Tax=Streptomyces boncukensis TaxID=2711219 RepID=A0A6G4WYD0_9ACTN|nr:questin oxidase family protein [Streptomyces boncukensis]NGO69617.1 questin oxidase family protein [Streptomyces boncukensis]